jgi:lysozyme family protein
VEVTDFDAAFQRTVGLEGGYVNDPQDPGGETRYGISKRAYPAEDIAGMTPDRAKVLYFRDYWGPAGCDAAPSALKFHLFDCAVNSGVTTAIKLLQKVVGETQDGILGPRTLQAVQSANALRLVPRFNGARLELMTSLPTWPTFGKGWAKRIASNLQETI